MGYSTTLSGVLTLSALPSVADPAAALDAVERALQILSQRRLLCTDTPAMLAPLSLTVAMQLNGVLPAGWRLQLGIESEGDEQF
eukprot:m51a1_g7968 hypothetical protein (84) ;mRNA; f:256527-261082